MKNQNSINTKGDVVEIVGKEDMTRVLFPERSNC